jgi:hypothetical protein
MNKKRRIHDGIAGALITAGVGLGVYAHPLWLVLPGGLGIALLQSGFTGFCPVYYVLDRIMPAEFPSDAPRSWVKQTKE